MCNTINLKHLTQVDAYFIANELIIKCKITTTENYN